VRFIISEAERRERAYYLANTSVTWGPKSLAKSYPSLAKARRVLLRLAEPTATVEIDDGTTADPGS
jgi:hypothetical protein